MLLALAYVLVLLLLALYGLEALAFAWFRLRLGAGAPPPTRDAPDPPALPVVTVQLPIFNEEYVLPRLLDAVASLDWPRDRLEVQVLDDSTDGTRALAAELAAAWRARGLDVKVLHREDRRGFKAGALKAGLAEARGDVVAIFDADFAPRRDFLRRVVPPLLADPGLACVQARWSHVNEEYSMLTRAQAMGIDGHFAVEQRVRNARGYPMNFNGTAGVWRAAAIRDAGGWSAETLAEDLDLSYRAQLLGWRFLYLDDVDAPAEVPTQVHAFKRQQARWAQGSIQCLRRHSGDLLRSRRLRPGAKVAALLHLSHYMVHPLMLALSILLLPVVLASALPLPLATALFAATFGPPALYAVGQRVRHPEDWARRLWRLVPLTLIGVGVAVSNTRAVALGLTRRGGEFRRTPKFRIERAGDSWRDKRYALPVDASVLGEAALCLVMVATVAVALATRRYAALPWALLFLASYGTVLGLSLRHHIRPKRASAAGKGVAAAAVEAP
jgi:cellulose synthase/poly-beta-1,6-N-acetylglucosamine synthase-like glycosyltransferase